MRVFITMMLIVLTGIAYSGEPSLGQARADSGDTFILLSPTNGQVFMREVVLKGLAGRKFNYVRVENTSLSNSRVTVAIKGGRWSATLPLVLGRDNNITLQAEYSNQPGITSTPQLQVRVKSSLDLTPSGLIFMMLAWAVIILLNIYAFVNIFGIKKEKIVEPLEIDTEADSR